MKSPFPTPLTTKPSARCSRQLLALGLALLASTLAGTALAQQGDGTRVSAKVNVFKPDKVDATDARIASIKAPRDFAVKPFATGLKNIRIVAVGPKDHVYVSRRDQGDVILLKDENHDGRADGAPLVVARRAGAHGLAILNKTLFLVTVHELFSAPLLDDGTLGEMTMVLGDLPDGGQHGNRTVAAGPDGMLYVSVGSTCNACNESKQESATLLRISPDGKQRSIYASGLRNTIGFDWNPKTGELWGFDNGIDYLGDDEQKEELNRIVKGKRYGWPHVYGAGGINPQSTPPGDISKTQWKAMSEPMVLGYTAHAAPMQLVFNRGTSFPGPYRNDAFATMRGSWNRGVASGYEIVRVRFEDGQATAIEPFVSGFLSDGGKTHFARPMGLAAMSDGSLLMADDGNGVLYRVSYAGPAAADAAQAQKTQPVAPVMTPTVEAPKDLATQRPALRVGQKLVVSSSSFAAGAAMAQKYSEYSDGVSPALAWSALPAARSYAVIAEDPDAKPITPFVHWLAWNIPASVTELPEGLQEQMRLTEPEGVLQGAASNGRVAYYGPHPPVGDAPHHYHFQVFALDTVLDLPPGADRDQLAAAMEGHVLAAGEVVGTFQQKVEPPK